MNKEIYLGNSIDSDVWGSNQQESTVLSGGVNNCRWS